MILTVSWRNVWRNKLRSSVILIAIALGVFSGVFTWAFYAGMVNQRVNTAIKTETSHIQLHHQKYLNDPDLKYYISDLSSIKKSIESLESVQSVSKRTISNAMILSAETGSGVKITGVEPEHEKAVTNLYTKITEGQYFEGIQSNPIVIGKRLADKLNVGLRSKVVVTLQQLDGTITRVQFRVAGLYKTTNSSYDERNIFVRNKDLSEIINLPREAGHELAILVNEHENVSKIKSTIEDMYPRHDIKGWRELSPEVSLIEESMDLSMYFFMIIILLALCFGIINTMLMAVLERVKELGMLMAVGMNKMRVFIMIVLETIFLSLSGGIAGIIIAYLITLIFNTHGIDLSTIGEAYARMGFSAIVYPVIDLTIAFKVALMVIATAIVSSIYPAIKALNLKPVEAIRIDN